MMFFLKRLFFLVSSLVVVSLAYAQADIPLPKMLTIPAGKFTTVGCPDPQRPCDPQFYVEKTVSIAAFALANTETTMAQWDACVDAGACVPEVSNWAYKNRSLAPPCGDDKLCAYPYDETWGRAQRPVINVNWQEVQNYIAWVNQRTGENYRLPTAEEWEYAALAGTNRPFPWGSKLGKNNANCDGCGSRWDNQQTAPVSSFKPNKWGLYDIIGNVNELTSTCIPRRQLRNDTSTPICSSYIVRGGAWLTRSQTISIFAYTKVFPHERSSSVGFRLAKTL